MQLDTILHGDALPTLRSLPSESAHCVITSPPYWSLRDYGVPGQLGLEPTPDEYVARLVEVFREARRVLRSDGTLWLNLGDSYASKFACDRRNIVGQGSPDENVKRPNRLVGGLKEKDLVGIPWRVAFALQADGWWLRSDIIWAKPNCMPESVRDRPTKAHEYVFLLAKSERYWYDADAVREPMAPESAGRYAYAFGGAKNKHLKATDKPTAVVGIREVTAGRNRRDVWSIASQPYAGAHFATMPPALVEPCLLAGCPVGGVVLDPFFGAGTVGVVARRHSRRYLGIELNAAYIQLAEERIAKERQPVLWSVAAAM